MTWCNTFRLCVPVEARMNIRHFSLVCLSMIWLQAAAPGRVTYDRLLNAAKDNGNWITYSGSYRRWRYSSLDQIDRRNASRLKVEWVSQMPTRLMVETPPLVVDRIVSLPEPPSNVVALDAKTGRQYWRYRRE